MNIVAYYTTLGLVIGEKLETLSDNNIVTLRNPASVIPQSQNIALMPLLAVIEGNELEIKEKDVISGEMTPLTEVVNHYKQMFGVGVQLVKKPDISAPR